MILGAAQLCALVAVVVTRSADILPGFCDVLCLQILGLILIAVLAIYLYTLWGVNATTAALEAELIHKKRQLDTGGGYSGQCKRPASVSVCL